MSDLSAAIGRLRLALTAQQSGEEVSVPVIDLRRVLDHFAPTAFGCPACSTGACPADYAR